jgi:hypothetical protein
VGSFTFLSEHARRCLNRTRLDRKPPANRITDPAFSLQPPGVAAIAFAQIRVPGSRKFRAVAKNPR